MDYDHIHTCIHVYDHPYEDNRGTRTGCDHVHMWLARVITNEWEPIYTQANPQNDEIQYVCMYIIKWNNYMNIGIT